MDDKEAEFPPKEKRRRSRRKNRSGHEKSSESLRELEDDGYTSENELLPLKFNKERKSERRRMSTDCRLHLNITSDSNIKKKSTKFPIQSRISSIENSIDSLLEQVETLEANLEDIDINPLEKEDLLKQKNQNKQIKYLDNCLKVILELQKKVETCETVLATYHRLILEIHEWMVKVKTTGINDREFNNIIFRVKNVLYNELNNDILSHSLKHPPPPLPPTPRNMVKSESFCVSSSSSFKKENEFKIVERNKSDRDKKFLYFTPERIVLRARSDSESKLPKILRKFSANSSSSNNNNNGERGRSWSVFSDSSDDPSDISSSCSSSPALQQSTFGV